MLDINSIKSHLISTRFGYLLAITAAALTGMIHSIPKQLFSFSPSTTELNPLTFIAIVCLINGLFFTPMKKDSAPISKLGKRNMYFILLVALAEVSGLVAYFFGLKQSTAINGSILTNSEIVFTILIALTIFKERLHKHEMIPFSVIIVGIIVLPIGYELFYSNLSIPDLLLGNLLIVLSGIFCSINVFLRRYAIGKVDPRRITQLVSFVGAALVLSIMAISHTPFQVDLLQLPSIALLGLFGSGFATFLFLVALKIIGTTRTLLLYSTNFVFGVVLATAFLHESVTLVNILSISLVSIGIFLLRNKLGTLEKFVTPVENPQKKGTYKSLCDSCTTKGCCTSFASPLLFPEDMEKLKRIGKYKEKYIKEIKIKGKEIMIIKKKEDSAQCVFWDNDSKKCSIYKSRPFDCMIYPFDIFPFDGKYYWIVYSCNPKSEWKWSESTLQTFENTDEFADILENVETYSHMEYDLRTKIDKTGYTVIREVNFSKLRNK